MTEKTNQEELLVVDFNEMAQEISEKSGIDLDVVVKVLEAEADYLTKLGIIEAAEDDEQTVSVETPKEGTYRHYKGGIYFVTGIATHTESEEKFVIYHDGKKTWARPLTMWLEDVEYEGEIVKRFTKL